MNCPDPRSCQPRMTFKRLSLPQVNIKHAHNIWDLPSGVLTAIASMDHCHLWIIFPKVLIFHCPAQTGFAMCRLWETQIHSMRLDSRFADLWSISNVQWDSCHSLPPLSLYLSLCLQHAMQACTHSNHSSKTSGQNILQSLKYPAILRHDQMKVFKGKASNIEVLLESI